jgi:HK97 family phage portal protein
MPPGSPSRTSRIVRAVRSTVAAATGDLTDPGRPAASGFAALVAAARMNRLGTTIIGGDDPSVPLVVTADDALTLSAFWRGVFLVADTLSGCATQEWRGTDQIPVSSVLEHPNPALSQRDFYWMTYYTLAVHHRAYWVVAAVDGDGRPAALVCVHPSYVTPPTGSDPWWRLGPNLPFHNDEIIELRRSPLPGPHNGLDLLWYSRRVLGAAIAADLYAARFWTESGIPPVVITHPNELTPEKAAELKADWLAAHGLMSRAPAVLSGGITVTPIVVNPKDSQTLESRQFAIQEVARFLNLPSWSLDGPTNDTFTYTNAVDRRLDLLQFGFQPYVDVVEPALTDRILPRGRYARIDTRELYAGRLADRIPGVVAAVGAGILSTSEGRLALGYPPNTLEPPPPSGSVAVSPPDASPPGPPPSAIAPEVPVP